jgi:hypothetical protein
MTRDEMINELREKTCRVIFKKVNGEERDMQCTLINDVLPLRVSEPKKERPVNENTIVAFDINKEAYRSFRVENVISFTCV